MKQERRISKESILQGSETEYSSPRLQKAYEMANKAHDGQKRKSREPYITHPVAVEKIIHEEWGIENENMRIAALLHDTVEDTDLTLNEIREVFGDEVAYLVFAETNLEASTVGVSPEKWEIIKDRENQRKILAQNFLDPRVGVEKLADRLHNMRTLGSLPEDKRKQIAEETLKVFAPLAEALGAWIVKTELEDLSFAHLNSVYYKKVEKEIDSDLRLNDYATGYWVSKLQSMLDEEGIEGKVEDKKNGYWSLVTKRRKASVRKESSLSDFDDINDVVSYRVIVKDEDNCYPVLGMVHKQLGADIDFRREDIFMWANKRDNGYQALQTTLETGSGSIEIAIVTSEMEEFNNWGVISKIREGEEDLSEYKLKLVFTPTGVVKFMKPGATGVDFAYLISSSLGPDAKALRIDGDIKPISTIIPNATVVEVITTEDTRIAPDKQLLEFALPETRRIIDSQLIIEENQKIILESRAFLSEEILSKRGLLDLDDLDKNLRKQILNRFGVTDVDSLCLRIAESQNESEFLRKIEERLNELEIDKKNMGLSTVRVKGFDEPGVLVELSSWITEKKGNVIKVSHDTEGDRYELRLVVTGMNKKGEDFIRKRLEKDVRFDSWMVV